MTQRSKQAAATKKKIANYVMTLCTQKDFEKITISDICNGANVSTGCFYHHFKCKEDVVTWSYADFDTELEKAINDNESFFNLSSLVQIEFVAKQYYIFLTTQELSYTINAYRSQLMLGNKYVGDKTRFFYTIVYDVANRWIQTGKLKINWKADNLADFIFRCIRGIAYDWCSRDGEYDLIQTGLTELRIIFEGLTK